MTSPVRLCTAPGCTQPATHQWQRKATTAEWNALLPVWHQQAAQVGVPDATFVPADGAAYIPVDACDTHTLPPAAASGLHQATCTAPPTCNCTPIYPPTVTFPLVTH